MTLYADYLSCAVPTPFRVLGVPLRPFCLGHLLILERLASPFATGAAVSQADLLTAALICSRSFEEAQHWIATANAINGDLRRLKRELRGSWFRRRKLDWTEALAMFGEYLADGQRQPDVWKHQPDGPTTTAPWQEIISVTLARTGWTESEILNCYLPRLWIRYYTAVELRMFDVARSPDAIRRIFVSPEERAVMDRARAAHG